MCSASGAARVPGTGTTGRRSDPGAAGGGPPDHRCGTIGALLHVILPPARQQLPGKSPSCFPVHYLSGVPPHRAPEAAGRGASLRRALEELFNDQVAMLSALVDLGGARCEGV
jgi:hypothetical protein